jgi:hypothetical protein
MRKYNGTARNNNHPSGRVAIRRRLRKIDDMNLFSYNLISRAVSVAINKKVSSPLNR